MFWVCLMNGAAGHTYGANGIWQCNRPGEPHGKSPHGGSYGILPWNEAMNLPGSRQVGLGRALLEQYRWQQFEPHPEWAACPSRPRVRPDGCAWIWFPEGNPAKDAPVAKRYFRRTFMVPQGKGIERASLWVSADDWCAVQLNGTSLGECADWRSGRQFDELGRLLKTGTNTLAIVAENKPAPVSGNPAGLIACLELRFVGEETTRLGTDDTWLCARTEVQHWGEPAFDDHGWPGARLAGQYGDGPWGRVGLPDNDGLASEPQAAGIPDRVRIIYVPENRSIEVLRLGAQASFSAAYFDPVSGEKKSIGTIRSDGNGHWRCPPPSGETHGWVVVLESR